MKSVKDTEIKSEKRKGGTIQSNCTLVASHRVRRFSRDKERSKRPARAGEVITKEKRGNMKDGRKEKSAASLFVGRSQKGTRAGKIHIDPQEKWGMLRKTGSTERQVRGVEIRGVGGKMAMPINLVTQGQMKGGIRKHILT